MKYTVTAVTDKGPVKSINQDSLFVRRLLTGCGEVVFAAVCDGLGGLSSGEIASAAAVGALTRWMLARLPEMCREEPSLAAIAREWESVLAHCSEELKDYGARRGQRLGTTALAALFTGTRYVISNIGDTRAYELPPNGAARRLTNDQTLAARDVSRGLLTPEQAERHPGGNVLLQCVGATENAIPETVFGEVDPSSAYLLCSDGFRREISQEEMYAAFGPGSSPAPRRMRRAAEELAALAAARGERDNISVVAIRPGPGPGGESAARAGRAAGHA